MSVCREGSWGSDLWVKEEISLPSSSLMHLQSNQEKGPNSLSLHQSSLLQFRFILPRLAIGGDRTDMEKLMWSYDKEHMKLAMLKHEQTFKEQVYELHRLYRIQKSLMKSFQGARDELRLPFMGEEDSYEDGIELTLGLGPMGYNNMRSRKRGGTTSPSFSSSTITGSSGQDKSRGNSNSEDGKGGHAEGDNVEDGRNRERMAKHSPWLIQAVLRLNQNSL